VSIKTCRRCGQEKPVAEFYQHRLTRDGYDSHCKSCKSDSVRQWRIENPEKFKVRKAVDYDRVRKRNPEKIRARRLVQAAVFDGRLVRPKRCPSCNRVCLVEAHHHDYSKPFEIAWLCLRCHRQEHRKDG
jgi:ferredoxin